jgi:hypothetical protein
MLLLREKSPYSIDRKVVLRFIQNKGQVSNISYRAFWVIYHTNILIFSLQCIVRMCDTNVYQI